MSPADVAAYLSVSRTTLFRILRNDPTFPPRIHLTARSVRFRGDLVRAWTMNRSQDAPSPRRGIRI